MEQRAKYSVNGEPSSRVQGVRPFKSLRDDCCDAFPRDIPEAEAKGDGRQEKTLYERLGGYDAIAAVLPTYYRGRDMLLTHRGMRICESDWNAFLGHAAATLATFRVSEAEQREVVAFVQNLKKDIVE